MPLPIANLAQLGLGLFEGFEGLRGLNKLSQTPYPQFTESPELRSAYTRAESMTGRGYTPEETAAFRQNLAGQSAQRYQRATDMAGGGLSGAIQAGINYGNIKGLLNFAADDASLHRRNIQYADSIARQIQSQKNLITQGQIAHRNQMEQAYGGGLRRGLENIVNPLNLTQALNWGNKNMTGTTFGDIGMSDIPYSKRISTTSIPQLGLSDISPYGYDFSYYGLKPQNPYTSAN